MRARYRSMPCVLLAALHLATLAAEPQNAALVELAIEIRDHARVPRDVMRETKAEVDRTFRASGVRVVWVDPTASPSSAPLTVYLIVGATTGPHADTSGTRVAGLAPLSGNWVQVFYRPVADAVADRQIPLSVVLAHVIPTNSGICCCRRTATRPSA